MSNIKRAVINVSIGTYAQASVLRWAKVKMTGAILQRVCLTISSFVKGMDLKLT